MVARRAKSNLEIDTLSDTEHPKEDEVLKRMLRTPHKKHEPTTLLGKRRRASRKLEQGSDSEGHQ